MPVKSIFKYFIILSLIGFFVYKQYSTPTVSVVMPVYNRENLVTRAIDSILAQSFKDFEFIIVDDGSTDSTPQILQDYAASDKRIKIITNKQNKGISFSRNRGMDAAKGEFIAIMDSDDYSIPDRLLKSVQFMRDRPDIDAMSSNIGAIDAEDNYLNYRPKRGPSYHINHDKGHYKVELLFQNSFQNIAAMFRRAFVVRHNIHYQMTHKTAEDWDFWLQFNRNNANMATIGEPLSFARIHNSNNPEYYDDMYNRTIQIKRENLKPFFTPEKDETPFIYSEIEVCHILRKIAAANEKKHLIKQEYLEDYYTFRCPQSDEWYFLNHTTWKGFIEKMFDNRWIRIGTDLIGTVQVFPEKLVIQWDNYPAEEFYKLADREYQFIPFKEKIKLIHPYWRDDFLYSSSDKAGCRLKAKDCGTISFDKNQTTATIQWKYFPPETFVYDPKTDSYTFKQE